MATKKQIAANRRNAGRSTGPRTVLGKAKSSMNSTRHGLLGQFVLIEGEDPEEFSRFEQGIRADLKPEGTLEESLVDRIVKDSWRLNRHDNIEAALQTNPESLDDNGLGETLNILRFFHDESGRRFDKFPQHVKSLIDIYLAEDKLDPSSMKDSQLAGAEKVARLMDELAKAEQFARVANERNSLELILVKNIIDRLQEAQAAASKASTQRSAEANRTEGKSGAPSTQASISARNARAFARNRGTIGLAVRYRTKIERSLENARHELQRLQAARHGHVVPPPEVLDVNVHVTGSQGNGN